MPASSREGLFQLWLLVGFGISKHGDAAPITCDKATECLQDSSYLCYRRWKRLSELKIFSFNVLFKGQTLVGIDLTCTGCKTEQLKLITDDISIDLVTISVLEPETFPLNSS